MLRPRRNRRLSRPARVPPPHTKVEVDGDVIQVDPATTSVQGHNLLERIAKLESAQPHRFVYRLDPLVVHRTFEQGVALSELTEGWTQHLTPKLPDHVAVRLAAWWKPTGGCACIKM